MKTLRVYFPDHSYGNYKDVRVIKAERGFLVVRLIDGKEKTFKEKTFSDVPYRISDE